MMTSHVAPCARMCAVRDVLLLRAPVINLPRPVLCCAISGFDCRCGNLFCGLHRYSDKHNCPYDYKAEAADKIRKENPVVVADKIQRIWRGLSGWLWILGAIGLKKKRTWAQPSSWRTRCCFFLLPLVCYTVRTFSPSAWKFTYIFSFHSRVCLSLTLLERCIEQTLHMWGWGGGSISANEGDCWRRKKKKVIALLWKCCRWLSGLFCDPPLPWDRLNFAWNELGHSGLLGLSDCYCCWLMASFQPCLLSAGLSSKMDVIIVCLFFFFCPVRV